MLKVLFEWFDAHPHSYWIIALLPTCFLLLWSSGWFPRESPAGETRKREALYGLLLLVVLLAWRWPFLLCADEYNPDESQLIAGALTLRVDPIPWRSVDGFTSGPLNFYPLLLPRLLGLPLDYFTARVMALLLIWIALLACYRLFRSWFGVAAARWGIAPALAFFCTVTDWDFIHYSSEHLSLFLLALSAGCLLGAHREGANRERWQLASCFIMGLLPWAKLQSAPLAATLLFVALVDAFHRLRGSPAELLRASAKRLVFAAFPSAVLLGVVILSGQFPHFFRSYLLQNFTYVGNGATVSATVHDLWGTARMSQHYPWYLGLSVLAIAVSLPRAPKIAGAPSRWIGAVLFGVAVICMLTPRRSLFHYVLLTVIPLALWFGLSVGPWIASLRERRKVWLSFGALVFSALPYGVRVVQPLPHMFGSFADHWREPRTVLAKIIRSYATPQSRLAIWGWLPSLFVETGLPQGTRDGNTSWAMMPSPHRHYYMQRFLADLQERNPDLFVDAVGFGSRFFPDRVQAGHESFPALAEYVRQHYVLIADEGYARFYAKPDLQPATPIASSAARLSLTNNEALEGLHRESITPANLPQWKLRNGLVQMMHPPAEIVWSLEPDTREVVFEYGFTPEAYRNARSDGVELIFELHSPGFPVRHVFYRLLDPVHRIEDRGPTSARLILPPFRPGARLVARTTVGPLGNGAWDWVYLSHVVPVILPHYSPAQFPNFNRVPDTADAELSYLLLEEHRNTLILHAPAVITYRLSGQERTLRFDFGFRDEAYTKGAQTDGAIFVVELRPNDEAAARSLFEKRLTPTSNAADRGPQPAMISLPEGTAGSTLVIRIDPGAGNAWDWTYLTNFILE